MSIFRFGKKVYGHYFGNDTPLTSDNIKKPIGGEVRRSNFNDGLGWYIGGSSNSQQDRYAPNNERLNAPSVLDEITPKSEKILGTLFRGLYRQDAVAGPAVDLISTLPWSDWTLHGIEDNEKLKVYRDATAMLDPETTMPVVSREFLVMGRFVGSLIFDKDKGTFVDLIPHDPAYLRFEEIPVRGFDPKIDVLSNAALKKFLTSNDVRDIEARQTIPDELRQKLLKGNAPLEPLNTLFLPRKIFPTNYLGTSIYYRILQFYALEKALWNATISSARRRARAITHVQVGIEGVWEPNGEDLNQISQMFMQAEEDPVGAWVVTRNGVESQDIRAGADFWRISEEWDMLTNGKMRALGINEAFLSGESTYNTMEAALSVFIENIKVFRQDITRRMFDRKIYANLARCHGFVKRSKAEIAHGVYNGSAKTKVEESVKREKFVFGQTALGKPISVKEGMKWAFEELEIPQLVWNKTLSPEGDAAYLDILRAMEEKGIPISLKMWASAGGVDLKKAIDSIEDDMKDREKIKSLRPDLTGGGAGMEGEQGGEAFSSYFPTLANANGAFNFSASGKKVFFGVGTDTFRKVISSFLKLPNRADILKDARATRRILSEKLDGNQVRIESALYLMNRFNFCKLPVNAKFLEKVSEKFTGLLTTDLTKDQRKNIYRELNFIPVVASYAEAVSHDDVSKVIGNELKKSISRIGNHSEKGNLYSGM